jgi:hypothetical protein
MKYNIYKNCTNQQFEIIKKRLDKLKTEVLKKYVQILQEQIRFNESDNLSLNFEFFNKEKYGGNLFVNFEDVFGVLTFSISIIKTIDSGEFRYYKRRIIAEHLSIDLLESNFIEYFNMALLEYNLWGDDEILKSERIKLEN